MSRVPEQGEEQHGKDKSLTVMSIVPEQGEEQHGKDKSLLVLSTVLAGYMLGVKGMGTCAKGMEDQALHDVRTNTEETGTVGAKHCGDRTLWGQMLAWLRQTLWGSGHVGIKNLGKLAFIHSEQNATLSTRSPKNTLTFKSKEV
eukprot:scaffold39878_cov17-Tisochrysis_lutea.AAC.2